MNRICDYLSLHMRSAFSFSLFFFWFFLLFFLCHEKSISQTLGGQATYNFLKLPSSPLLAATGGVNASYRTDEVSLTAANPALLYPELTGQVNVSFNAFLAATKAYSLTGALYSKKLTTTFSGHIHFLDYGSLPATDAAGNVEGQFRPNDYVLQVAAGKQYLEKWNYGLALKFVHSAYGAYTSSALAADVGVFFRDSTQGFSASVVVKNMGAQLKTYTGETEELPFDLQAGITKRLAKAPFGFSFTAQHLQSFNIVYNDTAFNRDNNIENASSTLAKIFTHFVLATHIYLGQKIEAHIGYNVLRRKELTVGTEGSGLTGFSAGLRIRFSKFQVLYARSAYQVGIASNQIGITILTNKLFGLGE